MITAVCHSEATGWAEVSDFSRISNLRSESGKLLWVKVDAGEVDDHAIAALAEEFGLHPLAVEDALNLRQRPKLETYEGHLFVVFHQLDEKDGQIDALQVACFVGDRYVLTIHEASTRTLKEAESRWRAAHVELKAGPGYLLYTLLDVVVDDYQRITDRLEDEIEELEAIALDTPLAPIQRQLYSLKQRLARLRRFALPVGRVIGGLTGAGGDARLDARVAALMADVEDHLLRIGEGVRSVEDLSQAVLDLHRAEQSHALNEVTKKLTAWAAIIAVPTFVTSLYGMNFALIPAAGELGGFFFALFLIIATAISLYVVFKRREWI